MNEGHEVELLAKVFENLGSNQAQALTMAKQMLKRADQLAEEKSIERSEALEHLMRVVIAGRKGEACPPIDSGLNDGGEVL